MPQARARWRVGRGRSPEPTARANTRREAAAPACRNWPSRQQAHPWLAGQDGSLCRRSLAFLPSRRGRVVFARELGGPPQHLCRNTTRRRQRLYAAAATKRTRLRCGGGPPQRAAGWRCRRRGAGEGARLANFWCTRRRGEIGTVAFAPERVSVGVVGVSSFALGAECGAAFPRGRSGLATPGCRCKPLEIVRGDFCGSRGRVDDLTTGGVAIRQGIFRFRRNYSTGQQAKAALKRRWYGGVVYFEQGLGACVEVIGRG